MKLTSASFLHEQPIPEQFAFGAPDPVLHVRLTGNHNPHLKWTGAPARRARSRSSASIRTRRAGPTTSTRKVASCPSTCRGPTFITGRSSTSRRGHRDRRGRLLQRNRRGRQEGPARAAGSRQGVNDYTSWFAAGSRYGGNLSRLRRALPALERHAGASLPLHDLCTELRTFAGRRRLHCAATCSTRSSLTLWQRLASPAPTR